VFRLQPPFNFPGVQPTGLPEGVATLEEVERAHITRVLEAAGWRVSGEEGAARILGMNAQTLNSRMKKLGIKRRKTG
jgi:formate hydrogenlyase transcriptional activator